jgi:alanyl-tRNA synthetase
MERFMHKNPSADEIRRSFLDYFLEQGHTVVPSASLVPGGDATLLFTNAGMVQFKDVFLGTDKRAYRRAVDSQKCMRVAGKHNDLEDVGMDDSHHTFFEMLGNWSFGDYYKNEAITWAWQLLTDVWGLPKSKLYATCFKDDQGIIPMDGEASECWRSQPGMVPDHVLFFGRKDNFWEMAETGPCGPCSEVHIDRGEEFCDLRSESGHQCMVNGDCKRFLELWNLVFIQYNRISSTQLDPLPATHVDTGMGFERIVSILQEVDSNYKTDLFKPALETIRSLTGDSETRMLENFTPYRVIADHARAATFLIADGVVPGNTGRNYVCRMIIRRAARFGTKIGLHEPFLAKVAQAFIGTYADYFPEVFHNRQIIIDNLTREETRFSRTIESGTTLLEELLRKIKISGDKILPGEKAFELYATYGLPFEISRDIAHEQFLDVDEPGFLSAMENHRLASGGGKAMGIQGGEDSELYNQLAKDFVLTGALGEEGVNYDPYQVEQINGKLLAIVSEGRIIEEASMGEIISVIVPRTGFYVEAGGQVSDTGFIRETNGRWEIEVQEMRKPSPGMIIHTGEVTFGQPKAGDLVVLRVDYERRKDIMRNHTATHLLHAELHKVLGEHALQAGSLVAAEKLRFDFNHNEPVTSSQLEQIEMGVNAAILADMRVSSQSTSRVEAIKAGATALFGEKYGEVVRTIEINPEYEKNVDKGSFSFELCGGTHLNTTGNIGTFLITSEGSAAAGIRRIEAVTGRAAHQIITRRINEIREISRMLSCSPDEIVKKVEGTMVELDETRNQTSKLRNSVLMAKFDSLLENIPLIIGIPVLGTILADADTEILRNMCDRFRMKFKSGIAVLGTVINGRPMIIATVTDDVIERGIKADELVKTLAKILGGSGGGKPSLAQAGGKNPANLGSALEEVPRYIEANLKK